MFKVGRVTKKISFAQHLLVRSDLTVHCNYSFPCVSLAKDFIKKLDNFFIHKLPNLIVVNTIIVLTLDCNKHMEIEGSI